jgi:hypothetical protein
MNAPFFCPAPAWKITISYQLSAFSKQQSTDFGIGDNKFAADER